MWKPYPRLHHWSPDLPTDSSRQLRLSSCSVILPSVTFLIPFTSKSSENVLQPGPCLISSILCAGPSRYYCWQEISVPSTSAVCIHTLCWGMSYRFSPLFKTIWQLPGWVRKKKNHICEYVSGLVYVGLYTYREAISCALPHLALWPISKHAFCDSLLRHCL